MTTYNLFGLGQQSKSANITAAHRLNIYYDIPVGQDRTNIAAYGTPGLAEFCYISGQPTLGMHWIEANDSFYVIQANALYQVFKNGTFTHINDLNDTPALYVGMANNGKELIMFTGVYAYVYNIQTAVFTDITASLPWVTTPGVDLAGNSVSFLDAVFVSNRPGTGQFYISNQYDGLTWDVLNFATAESNPDSLVAVVADKGNLALLGTSSVEIWSNIGDQAFPFQRINASPNEGGLAARWSLSKCKGSIIGLFRNKNGALSVCMLNGYMLEPISDTDMDYIFNNYASPTDAVGFGYTLNGRSYYEISFRTEGKTWLYDFQSNVWSQLESPDDTRHYANFSASFDTLSLVSDYRDGRLYILDADCFTDNGQTIIRSITGTHNYISDYDYISVSRLIVDIAGGTVLDNSDPKMMLSISRDYGHTWGREMWVSMGKIGNHLKRAEWRRLGQARDWIYKIRIVEPIKVVIMGASLEGKVLNK